MTAKVKCMLESNVYCLNSFYYNSSLVSFLSLLVSILL